MAELPKFLWSELVHHATWLKNRMSTCTLPYNKTPFELMFNSKPDLSDLPEWGTKVFVLKESSGKLEAKADKGRWVGYSDESKGHRIYWPGKHCVTVEHNMTFDSSVITVPVDVQVEGENRTSSDQYTTSEKANDIPSAPPNNSEPSPTSPTPIPSQNPSCIDLLEDFEVSEPVQESQLQTRSQRQ
ncbi:hypothetical protein K439DRAFT_1370798 [Ramaria rubella]|nr:hypothetical protein K439DRAFT_1370798 [Ramaria rubella]